MPRKKISSINDELDPKLFFYIARKSVLYIIFIFALALTAAYLYLRYTPPVYETKSVIQLNTEEKREKIFSMKDNYDEDLAKYVEILKSPVFLKNAFKKLPLKISYYTEGTILNFEQYKASPYTIEADVTNSAYYGLPIYVAFDNKLQNVTYSFTINEKQKEKTFSVNDPAVFPGLKIKMNIIDPQGIKKNETVLKKDRYFFQVNNLEKSINRYINKLKVDIVNRAAKSIQISIKDENPRKATDFVNTIADEFIQYDIEKKQESANKILEYINKQLDFFYDKLYKSELKLEQFREKHNVDSIDMKPLPTIHTRLNDLEDQYFKIKLEFQRLEELEVKIQKNDTLNIYRLIANLAGSEFQGVISNLLGKLQELLLKKEELLFEVTPNSKQVEAINYQIEIQKKLLVESIKALKEDIEKKKQEIQDKISDYERAIKPKKGNYSSIELNRLERIHSINEKYYWQLVDKKAEYSISKAGYVSKFIFLEKAEAPRSPIYPIKKKVFVAAFIAAIILSLAIIFSRYILYNNIQSVNDISKYTDVSILGIIPKYKKHIPVSQLIVDKSPKSVIAESLRTIRTNLQFISSKSTSKIIAVTSTISGEGKTFVAINLAGIISFSDKKVIVLDLDMRKPRIHKGFGVENTKGMSTILSGRDNVSDCIIHSELPNLHIITAGPVPPNPSELILNENMNKTLEELKQVYDYIIIDNPPVGIVTDAVISFQKADYPVYVFKANYSKKPFIQTLHRICEDTNIKGASVILNAVEKNFVNYGIKGYYNYGGYGYGFGYGYYDEDQGIKKRPFFKRLLKKLRK